MGFARAVVVLAGFLATVTGAATPFYVTFTGYSGADISCSAGSPSFTTWQDDQSLLSYTGCKSSSGCCLSGSSYYSVSCDAATGSFSWLQYTNANCAGTPQQIVNTYTKGQCYLDKGQTNVYIRTSGCFTDKKLIPAGYTQYAYSGASGSLLTASHLLLATLGAFAAVLHTGFYQ